MPAKRTGKSKTPAPKAKAAKAPAKPAATAAAKRPAPSSTVSAVPDAGAARISRSVRPTAKAAGGADAAGRAQRWAQVTARDLMRESFVTVDYSAPLSEVERVLSENRLLGVPVVDEAGQIMGVVSVKDLMDRYAEDPDAKPRRGHGYFRLSTEELGDEDAEAFEVPEESEDTARDVMSAQVFTVPASAGLREIADVLCQHKIHRVLVEDAGKLIGLIGTLDVMEALRA